MTDTQTICACIVICFTSSMLVSGYWLKKRKQVSVTKIVKINVKSDDEKDKIK